MARLAAARTAFHAALLAGPLTVSDRGIPSNADSSSAPSRRIALGILDRLGPSRTAVKLPGQTAGANFETLCAAFLEEILPALAHLRPGRFEIAKGGGIARFEQYAHLDELEAIARSNRDIATALGSDYLIKPDIVIARRPEPDAAINARETLVDATVARHASIRAWAQPLDLLHASISCKWTLRSDRAQNARSEGLNLVRNRKGRLPHVAVVTGEPLPSRIASLALGTGDIDCVYHFALPELRATLDGTGDEGYLDTLDMMVEGKRLKDISDLPLDLVA
ncbi:NgoMIV family type II restriction endonuclease [Mangrovicoccus algicola]|uniref:Restriction endonuclease n=1 Tax=Mangrovicoccus algicola TaxID=2771008 RepID=A0A8J6Z0H7_9RHOB|nr:NgoMIV family type II restriction endonuclease [Mangrovicoccus algicola]MBE3639323.1 restriction endonuclease [Mangrovicoccus algicola]